MVKIDRRKIKYDKRLYAYTYETDNRKFYLSGNLLWIEGKETGVTKVYTYNEWSGDFVSSYGDEFFVRCNAIGDDEASEIVIALLNKQRKNPKEDF